MNLRVPHRSAPHPLLCQDLQTSQHPDTPAYFFLNGKSCGAARGGLNRGNGGSHQPNLHVARISSRMEQLSTHFTTLTASSHAPALRFAGLFFHSAQVTLHPHTR
ncbi:unnamed protein product [Pleuronectes platessa]|uniref:Uncharacterized protein n=1 Tax=Pleuronectes platessa TaxID=8262 RepID=A0A9N7UUN5_PLEPL|nr:unnamed protein product [Pleuronectes platessa]